MFNFKPWETIAVASVVTVIFSALGGLRAVLLTDFLLFIVAMIGAVAAAVVALQQPEVGGLGGLLSSEQLQGKLSILPALVKPDGSSNLDVAIPLLIMPLVVQWWSVWYPGAEPGGGGYIAQRMLSAKNEKHAVGATFFFNAAHYALRPWPWILVALASLIVFPDLESIAAKFPHVTEDKLGHDLAYPAMLTFLPVGLLGLVVASLIAAYMSTISTHLNWGSSYVVNDFWKRFVRPSAPESEYIWVGRITTVLLMVVAGFLALQLRNAKQAFDIIIGFGAGTGVLFLLRWFWWRINAFAEMTAMVVAAGAALYFHAWNPDLLKYWQAICVEVGVTTIAWVAVMLATPADDPATLRSFYRLIRPGGPGWRKVIEDAERDGETITGPEGGRSNLPLGILCMVLGCFAVYSALFGAGYWIYGNTTGGLLCAILLVVSAVALAKLVATLWRADRAASTPR